MIGYVSLVLYMLFQPTDLCPYEGYRRRGDSGEGNPSCLREFREVGWCYLFLKTVCIDSVVKTRYIKRPEREQVFWGWDIQSHFLLALPYCCLFVRNLSLGIIPIFCSLPCSSRERPPMVLRRHGTFSHQEGNFTCFADCPEYDSSPVVR